MNINERLTPIGIVEIYDEETGELVFKTHNMIVEDGRKMILKAVFNNTPVLVQNFRKFYEGGNEAVTTPTMHYNNISANIIAPGENNIKIATVNGGTITYSSITVKGTTYTDTVNVTGENVQMQMHFKLESPEDVMKPITAIGLYYIAGENNNVLFSRATIDPVYMRPGRMYVCHYTMYY